ncbi:YjiH family protein [Aneurinibacillus aneurinilyticus]|jgi:nucleoside recognition membrane protein YjiH|nr:YjiH family protein [Aneurinibacillus aneurinilyticus]MCI1693185.1 YjiH family protein [Aneurinibacillus aneurinilyticus]MED0671225.1 YjiH family protein [Aneurinibacillus aneurinilyticus]MED0707579.1 YjiH family protein [Aneurinibacillus aneurinilyticus]MED0725523.1 YjiH family protein [Aneurinibacillus aneurinilyticus]MED0734613.1 YjiH family protein [Aneurinibacillus aneurinilyticus]
MDKDNFNLVTSEIPSIQTNGKGSAYKFFIFSFLGIFAFFVPITIEGNSTIVLDHIVNAIKAGIPSLLPFYALLVIFLGSLYPFISKTWKKDKVNIVFSFLKIIGFFVAVMLVFHIGPAWLFEKDMGPFLLEKLVIPVGLLVPIGSVFLALLTGYGLLEFIGVLVRPIMRPIWKTPGRSAVDAVASFVGSYSIGLLITNRVFKEGKYTIKEACIIATGFSTVSTPFMIVVAKTLDIMPYWNQYFWTTLVITFIVTAITVRIRPLSRKSDTYYTEKGDPEPEHRDELLKSAWNEGMKGAHGAPSLLVNITQNFKDGFVMTMGILPSIMSIGLLGLVLAKYTPLFDIIGYVFYPLALLVQIPEPMLASKALSVGIAEMFLPALVVASAPLVTKFVIAVVSVSSVLFFSASIPCILSTEIPISIPQLIIVWFQRTLLTFLLVTPVAFLLF